MNTKTTVIVVALIAVIFGALFWFSRGGGGATGVTAVTEGDWVRGAENAKLELIEYGDFQCPACAAYEPLLLQAQADFKDSLVFAYRQFPLMQIHPNGLPSAKASEAAGKQGKFWEMHDLLYKEQEKWSDTAEPKKVFTGYAKTLGLDIARFSADFDSKETEAAIQEDFTGGLKLGVQGTPTFFLNGKKISNPSNYQDFKAQLEDALVNRPIQEAAAATNEYHTHADFIVYVNGMPVDFSKAKYQSDKGSERDEGVHLHDGNGKVIHIHKEGITLRYFLSTLGMVLTSDCFGLDTGERYCTGGGKTLGLFVNGEPKSISDYQMKDLDRVLLTFGNDTEATVAAQALSVADTACIFSSKCPERGKPPLE